MITFASPLTPDQQINVKQCYARQAGVPFGNVEMTAAMRRDSEYKVTIRANDASVLAQVKTKLQEMRKLTAAIVATVLISPPSLPFPAGWQPAVSSSLRPDASNTPPFFIARFFVAGSSRAHQNCLA